MNTPLDKNTLRHATPWLPAKALRVTAIGWNPPSPDPGGREWRSWGAPDLDKGGARGTTGRPVDAVVWLETPATTITRRRLARVRSLLADGGGLVLLRPIAVARSPMSSDAGSVAPETLRRALQNLILLLSELGFAIRRERAAAQPGSGALGILVARRDRYRIRPFRRDDGPAIGPLFARCFHVERPAEAWRWKFEHNPYGRRLISVATDEDGTMVGHYAGLPFRLVDARATPRVTYDALQLCEIMTAPSVRRSGLGPTAMISRLWRHFYAAFAEHRVAFVIGFNTASSRGMAMRFHRATELEPVSAWRRDAASVPARVDGYRVAPMSCFGRSCDRLFARAAPAYGALVERDRRYLGWRYGARPDAAYQIYGAYRWRKLVAWGVFRRQEDTLIWGDALCDPAHEAAAEALLAAAVAAENDPPREVFGWFAHRPTWWREALADAGWRSVPEPNELSLIYGMHSSPEAEPALRTFYYTMGDSDLF